ncbi:MAG: sodium:solute symporter family protein [Archaeoglobaceae archaeon]
MNEVILALAIYMAIGTAIAFYAKGAKTQEDYFIGRRNIGGLVSALTYAATTYSAFMMVGLVGLSYASGVGAAGFELMYLVGTLFLLSFYAPKIWKTGKECNVVSPTEFLSLRYGKETARLAAIICLIALVPYISAQLIGVALILEISGIEFYTGIAIAAFLIALWAFIGGLRGVALTDAIQGLFMLFAALALLSYVTIKTDFSRLNELGEILYVPNSYWNYTRFAALVIPWFFFALTNPQVFQRIFIPRDEKALRRMVIYFGLFGLIYTFIVTFLGLELRILSLDGSFPYVSDRDKVTPTLMQMVPTWIALLVCLSILMASITTANSIILSLSSMVSRDIVGERGIKVGKISIIVLTAIVAIFAARRLEYIVELSVLSSTILLCQLPLIIGYFHWNRGGKFSGILTLIAGFTTSIVFWKVSIAAIPGSAFVIIISVLTYVIACLFEKQSS